MFFLKTALVLSVFILSINSNSSVQTTVEAYLIPANYTGKVVVVFKRPFGNHSKVLGDTTFYFIQSDGIAIVSNTLKTTIEKSIFITVDEVGNRKILPIHTEEHFQSSDSLRYKSETGIIVFGIIGSCDSTEQSNFCYLDFYVGTRNEMAKHYTPEKASKFSENLFRKAKWRQ
jgi:hypothetical protein